MFSQSSKPEYTPQVGTMVAASMARRRKAAGGPSRSGPERMSGVLVQKAGRM